MSDEEYDEDFDDEDTEVLTLEQVAATPSNKLPGTHLQKSAMGDSCLLTNKPQPYSTAIVPTLKSSELLKELDASVSSKPNRQAEMDDHFNRLRVKRVRMLEEEFTASELARKEEQRNSDEEMLLALEEAREQEERLEEQMALERMEARLEETHVMLESYDEAAREDTKQNTVRVTRGMSKAERQAAEEAAREEAYYRSRVMADAEAKAEAKAQAQSQAMVRKKLLYDKAARKRKQRRVCQMAQRQPARGSQNTTYSIQEFVGQTIDQNDIRIIHNVGGQQQQQQMQLESELEAFRLQKARNTPPTSSIFMQHRGRTPIFMQADLRRSRSVQADGEQQCQQPHRSGRHTVPLDSTPRTAWRVNQSNSGHPPGGMEQTFDLSGKHAMPSVKQASPAQEGSLPGRRGPKSKKRDCLSSKQNAVLDRYKVLSLKEIQSNYEAKLIALRSRNCGPPSGRVKTRSRRKAGGMKLPPMTGPKPPGMGSSSLDVYMKVD